MAIERTTENGSASQHSLLSDRRILQHLQDQNIVIFPFDIEKVKTSSVDVSLGPWYFRPQAGSGVKLFNPWSKKHVEAVFGEPQLAKKAYEEFGDDLPDAIDPEDRVIIAYPGKMILCHTEEFIGGRNEITTMMKARSSIGRCDIVVCKCAGWGDVGFFNRWTMEVTANGFGLDLPVVLTVGRRVAQITFFETGPTLGEDYSATGKYQTSASLDELKASWKPEMMLPRLWKDGKMAK